MNNMHQTNLVTGGAGFIGSHLVDKLINQGQRVIVVDNLSGGKKENLNPKADFYNLDVCDFKKIKPIFAGVDFVFHLAAIPRVPLSVEDPVGTSKVNILGTVNVFKAAVDAKVKRIIFASSSSVYGDQKKFPLLETLPPNPKSPYALQKFIGERFAKMFNDYYKIPIVCLRYFNVYGPRQIYSDYSGVITQFMGRLAKNLPLVIFGDGEQTRDFVYIQDIVEANVLALKCEEVAGEIFNIGAGVATTINQLASVLLEITNKTHLGITRSRPREGDIMHSVADISKARKKLGYSPKISLKDGLGELTRS